MLWMMNKNNFDLANMFLSLFYCKIFHELPNDGNKQNLHVFLILKGLKILLKKIQIHISSLHFLIIFYKKNKELILKLEQKY